MMKPSNTQVLIFISFLCSALSDADHNKELRTRSQGGTGTSDQPNPFTVLEVRRVRTVDRRTSLTVKYKVQDADIDIKWNHKHENLDRVNNTVVDETGGVYETSILLDGHELAQEKNRDNPNFYYHGYALADVTLCAPEYGESLTLSLQYDEGDRVERDIPNLPLELEPVGDFVYEEEQDFTFQLTFEPKKPRIGLFSMPPDNDYDLTTYLLHPETGEVLVNSNNRVFGAASTQPSQRSMDYEELHQQRFVGRRDVPAPTTSNDELFELVNTETFGDIEERTVKIKTSEYRTSGLLVFTAKYSSVYEYTLIEATKQVKVVTLHPSSQTGPFPDDFIDFVHGEYDISCKIL